MKVTAVIPTYNRARLLGEAVRSVLDQSFADLELIVVDDGSTDATPAVLAAFKDDRLQVIAQENAGTAAALATGFENARGEYVISLGSDDRWLPHCLSRLVESAEADHEAVVVYGRARAVDLEGRPLRLVTGNPEPFPGRTHRSALYGDFVPAIAALVLRGALDDVGGIDRNLAGAEDWDLWVRLAARGHFRFVDEVVAEFRLHPGRSTSSRRENLERLELARLHVLDKAFARHDLPPDVLEVRDLAYRNAYVDIGLRWVAARSPRRAAAAFRHALTLGPPLATLFRIAYLAVFHALVPRYRLVQLVSDTAFRRRRLRRAAGPPSDRTQAGTGRKGGPRRRRNDAGKVAHELPPDNDQCQ